MWLLVVEPGEAMTNIHITRHTPYIGIDGLAKTIQATAVVQRVRDQSENQLRIVSRFVWVHVNGSIRFFEYLDSR